MMKRAPRLSLLAVLFASMTLVSCKENPIDVAIEEALNFSGIFEASDGTEIELSWNGDEGSATVRKVGTTELPVPLSVGDKYMMGMVVPDKDFEEVFRGSVIGDDGFMVQAEVRVRDDFLIIDHEYDNAIPNHVSWDRIANSTPPDDDDDDDTPSASVVLLYQKNLEGDDNSSTYFTVTVPSGTKKLVVTTFEEDQWGHNLGDLFVSRGQRPVVQSEAPYRWTADKSSINPNREDEVITFPNPPAGTYHILLYGYHEYYSTSLKATISK